MKFGKIENICEENFPICLPSKLRLSLVKKGRDRRANLKSSALSQHTTTLCSGGGGGKTLASFLEARVHELLLFRSGAKQKGEGFPIGLVAHHLYPSLSYSPYSVLGVSQGGNTDTRPAKLNTL